MFGARFFGKRFFGNRFFGVGSSTPIPPAPPASSFPINTIMRRSTVTATGAMSRASVDLEGGTISTTLALNTIMRRSTITMTGAMSNDPITITADLL